MRAACFLPKGMVFRGINRQRVDHKQLLMSFAFAEAADGGRFAERTRLGPRLVAGGDRRKKSANREICGKSWSFQRPFEKLAE